MKKSQVISILLLAIIIASYVVPFTTYFMSSNSTDVKEIENKQLNNEILLDNYLKIFNTVSYTDAFIYKSKKQTTSMAVQYKVKDDIQKKVKPNIDEIEWSVGWLNSNSNIRVNPNLNSKVITVLNYSKKIKYAQYDKEWNYIKYKKQVYFIHKELVSDEEIIPMNYTTYYAPQNGIKSYMPYQAITSTSSKQYKLQQIAYTGNYGIRQVKDRYCVALGSAYTTEMGTYFDLILENDTVIPCILGDQKADKDTDSSHRVSAGGSLAEFIVNQSSLSNMVKRMGSLDYACNEWNSPIKQVIIYDEREVF